MPHPGNTRRPPEGTRPAAGTRTGLALPVAQDPAPLALPRPLTAHTQLALGSSGGEKLRFSHAGDHFQTPATPAGRPHRTHPPTPEQRGEARPGPTTSTPPPPPPLRAPARGRQRQAREAVVGT